MNSQYAQGETLIAKISGSLESISKLDVLLYRNHVRVPFSFEMKKIDGNYYLYSLLSEKEPNNYSLVLKDIKYYSQGKIVEEDYSENFTITENFASFSVSPGFIESGDNFEIQLQNLRNYELPVSLNKNSSQEQSSSIFDILFGGGSEGEEEIVLLSGEKRKINLAFENLTESGWITTELNAENTTYFIPIYVIVEERVSYENETKEIKFYPSEISVNLATNSSTQRIVYLKNIGDADIENITISIPEELRKYVELEENIFEIEKNESEKIILNISSGQEEKQISDFLTAKISGEEVYAYLTLNLSFIPNYIPSEEEEENRNIILSCSEMGGNICSEEETCSGELEYATDGECCLGTCEEEEIKPTSPLIGWIIVIVLVLLIAWFFLTKYRKTGTRKISLLDVAKRKK
jgi:hypothetical protein